MTNHPHYYMSRAIQLAQKGLYTTQPNPRVGCVIVKDGQIVGKGWHQQAGGPHAEVFALRAAGEQARGATAYVTLEPCSHQGKTPPCADALIDAGVAKVIAAMEDPNPLVAGKGLQKIRDAGIAVESGLLEAEARQLNPGFIKRMSQGLPFVRVKLAMSLDGRTAMASGESVWITGEAARADVQKLRARSSAILTGSGTVLMDNPSLNLRLSAAELGCEVEPPQPLRVIVDSQLKTPTDAKTLDLPGNVLILSSKNTKAYPQANVQVVPVETQGEHINLHAALKYLASLEINEVHVEAGSVLCGALLQAQLADELVIYMAPHLMGDSARGLFHLPGLSKMAQRLNLEISEIRPIAKDWRITAIPKY